MKCWSFYRISDGLFTGETFTSSTGLGVDENTPDGCAAIEGIFDYLSQRVDINTGHVVDYQPPRPDEDHIWNAETRRWVLKPEIEERRVRVEAALIQIEQLEKHQQRAIREAFLDPNDEEARARVVDIDTEISQLRAIIQENS